MTSLNEGTHRSEIYCILEKMPFCTPKHRKMCFIFYCWFFEIKMTLKFPDEIVESNFLFRLRIVCSSSLSSLLRGLQELEMQNYRSFEIFRCQESLWFFTAKYAENQSFEHKKCLKQQYRKAFAETNAPKIRVYAKFSLNANMPCRRFVDFAHDMKLDESFPIGLFQMFGPREFQSSFCFLRQ